MKLASKEIRLALSFALIDRLWEKGLITDDEKKKIKEREKVKILSTKD